jgi:hypothetical protein
MLIEQHEKLKENVQKNIELSQEQAKIFRDAHAESTRKATEELAKFTEQQKHALDNVDLLTKAMEREIAMRRELLATMRDSATAATTEYEARVRLAELEGRLTGPEANAAITAAREQAEVRRAEAEYEERIGEARDHASRSTQAGRQAAAARNAVGPGSNLRERQRVAIEDLLDAQGLLPGRQAAATAAEQAVAAAQADERTGPGVNLTPFDEGASRRHAAALRHRVEQAEHQNEVARAALEATQENIARFTQEGQRIDEEIHRHEELATTMENLRTAQADLAAETVLAADHQRQRNAITAAATHDTTNINRQAELLGRIHDGTASDDDRNEYAGLTGNLGSTRNRQTGQSLPGIIGQAEIALHSLVTDRSYGTGTASADVMNRIHIILETLIGAHQNTQASLGNFGRRLDELDTLAHQLDSAALNGRWQGTY